MNDDEIVDLFLNRSEEAIAELSLKYGRTVRKVAINILGNSRDAEECENDTYLACWNTIPPQHPTPLAAYICRITRNIATTRYHSNNAAKRNSGYDIVLDELEECIPGKGTPEEEFDRKELSHAINIFLGKISREDRITFVRRYWYSDSVSEISAITGLPEKHISSRLCRTRKKLHRYLKKEGYIS